MINDKELAAKINRISKITKRAAIVIPSLEEDRAINAAARNDVDAQPLTAKQLATMVPLRTLRGRPKSASPKTLVSVRYSQEVIDYSEQPWQSRTDQVLRKYVMNHSWKTSR
jgi:uncharacterized protein (DUF4415 family)